MGCISLDLTIEGALADPVIAAVMRSDHVDPQGFEALLRSAARQREGARLPAPLPLVVMADRIRAAVTGSKPLW